MKKILITVLLSSFSFSTAFAIVKDGTSFNFQMINATGNKLFKHCRVSPNGFARATNRIDYMMIDTDSIIPSDLKFISKRINRVINKRYKSTSTTMAQSVYYTCGISHKSYCSGYPDTAFLANARALMHIPSNYSSFTDVQNDSTTMDSDSLIFILELNMRLASANYSFPDEAHYNIYKTDYTGWSAYNVSIVPNGSLMQAIVKVPPLLQIECDLYDDSDQYLNTFGFIFRHDQLHPQFYNGGDSWLDYEIIEESSSLLTYKITYNK